MTIKIGINGFGRIGRMVFRAAVQNFANDIEVVGINDLLVNGKKIRLTAVKNPAELAWGDVGADIVIESTGLFLTKETAEAHLKAGAKKAIMSAPSKDDTPMFVYGVNDKTS